MRSLVVVVGADLGGEGEAGRHGQADVGHLGEVGALAAEEVLHVGPAFRLAAAEEIDVLGGHGAASHACGRAAGRARPGNPPLEMVAVYGCAG